MELTLTARSVEMDAEDRRDLETRLRQTLARSSTRMRCVRVCLEDVNGPKGGLDQRCRIEALVTGLGPVDATGRGTSPMAAARQAARILVHRIRRLFGRERAHRAYIGVLP